VEIYHQTLGRGTPTRRHFVIFPHLQRDDIFPLFSKFFQHLAHLIGTVSREFLLLIFFLNQLPPSPTLLQGLTFFSYPDQVPLTHFVHRAKKFLACEPEFSVEFSAPLEFSGGVMEKYLSTG
jgi:hypothetical protein